MKLIPEIMLVDDATLDALRPTLERATAMVQMMLEDVPSLREKAAENGWTPRMMAWGYIVAAGAAVEQGLR